MALGVAADPEAVDIPVGEAVAEAEVEVMAADAMAAALGVELPQTY